MVRCSALHYYGVAVLIWVMSMVGLLALLAQNSFAGPLIIASFAGLIGWIVLPGYIRSGEFVFDVKTRKLFRPGEGVLSIPGREVIVSKLTGEFEFSPVKNDHRSVLVKYGVRDLNSLSLAEELIGFNRPLDAHVRDICVGTVRAIELSSWDQKAIEGRLRSVKARLSNAGVVLNVSVRTPLELD